LNIDKYKDIDDNQLLQHFYADRNNEWLGVLLQRYTFLLLGVCMKYLKNEDDAKDSVQQVFEKVLSEIPKYQVTYFKSWLYMVAKNHCLMKLRSKGQHFVEVDERITITTNDEEDKKLHLEKDALLNNVETALQQLNKEQRECVTLFYLEKKSYQEITEITSYSLLQVKSYIQNGKRNLKMILENMQQQ